MSADKELKAYIDRVLRLKEEQDELGRDIRDIYAEAKSSGYDKTVMGKLVAHLRKVLKEGDGAVIEQENVFDTYLQAYHRASGTPVATHTHEPDYDRETGEVFDINPRFAKQVVDGMQTETGRAALMAAVDIMIEREEAEEQNSPETANEVPAQDGSGTALGESHGGKPNAARPASTDAQPNVRGSTGQGEESGVTVVGTESGTVSISPSDDDAISEVNGNAGLENAADVEPSSSAPIATASQGEAEAHASTNVSLPVSDRSGEGANTGGRHVTLDQSTAAPAGAPFSKVAPAAIVLRPNCRRPEMCGSGTKDHCGSCQKAMRQLEAAE
jgi:uncharacterized protein (UPF0335 family)